MPKGAKSIEAGAATIALTGAVVSIGNLERHIIVEPSTQGTLEDLWLSEALPVENFVNAIVPEVTTYPWYLLDELLVSLSLFITGGAVYLLVKYWHKDGGGDNGASGDSGMPGGYLIFLTK